MWLTDNKHAAIRWIHMQPQTCWPAAGMPLLSEHIQQLSAQQTSRRFRLPPPRRPARSVQPPPVGRALRSSSVTARRVGSRTSFPSRFPDSLERSAMHPSAFLAPSRWIICTRSLVPSFSHPVSVPIPPAPPPMNPHHPLQHSRAGIYCCDLLAYLITVRHPGDAARVPLVRAHTPRGLPSDAASARAHLLAGGP